MINNRQNGRRRGRGGAQVRGQGNGPDRGNRIDNRARGNAAQLHEKYKNLARDAQTQGDRVMTEYYLQFADHYFRVLNENRARFEDQNQNQRRRYENDDFDGEGDEGETADDGQDETSEQQPPRREREQRDYRDRDRDQRREYREREPREQRQPREPQPMVAEQAPAPAEAAPAPSAEQPEAGAEPRRRRGRPPKRRDDEGQGGEAPRIDAATLPPSFSAASDEGAGNGRAKPDAAPAEEGEPAPKRRRTRKVATSDADVAA